MVREAVKGRKVRAGDVGFFCSSLLSSSTSFDFRIEGCADPDVLARVCNLVSLANVLPRCCRMERRGDSQVIIRIQIDGISGSRADSIRRKLVQLTSIIEVKLQSAG